MWLGYGEEKKRDGNSTHNARHFLSQKEIYHISMGRNEVTASISRSKLLLFVEVKIVTL